MGRKERGKEGREREKERKGIWGRRREGKENGNCPPTIFGLKVAPQSLQCELKYG